MGSESSKGKRYSEAAKYGQLFVQTDKSTYFGGDTVTGRIYLNLIVPYPGNQLSLKLKGQEFSAFVRTRTETYHESGPNNTQVTKTRNIDELFQDKSHIVKMVLPLYSWATLLPGQYTIPFAFMLPSALPNTFFQEGNRYRAEVSYRLEAILEPSIPTEPKLKYKQPFVVRNPVRNAMQSLANEIRTEIKTCLCLSKGANTLKAHFEKNYYAPGETAQVIMQLDNTSCSTASTTIAFTLNQRLVLTAKGRQETKEFIKVQRNLEGVAPGTSSSSNLIAINLPTIQGKDGAKFTEHNLKQYLMSLQEAHGTLNSATKSRLVTSEYFLRVSCPMEGCCATTPGISCPIEIYYPEIQLYQPSAPTDWAPQEVGIVNISFADAPLQLYTGQSDLTVDSNKTSNMVKSGMMSVGNMMMNKLPSLLKDDSNKKEGQKQSHGQQSASTFGGDSYHYETQSSHEFHGQTNTQSSGNNNDGGLFGSKGLLGGFGGMVMGGIKSGVQANFTSTSSSSHSQKNSQGGSNLF